MSLKYHGKDREINCIMEPCQTKTSSKSTKSKQKCCEKPKIKPSPAIAVPSLLKIKGKNRKKATFTSQKDIFFLFFPFFPSPFFLFPFFQNVKELVKYFPLSYPVDFQLFSRYSNRFF